MPLRQEVQHPLEALHPVAVARDQPTTNGIGRSPESVELGLEDLVAMVEGLRLLGGVDQRQHVGRVIVVADAGDDVARINPPSRRRT
jgi:hypothetical protein